MVTPTVHSDGLRCGVLCHVRWHLDLCSFVRSNATTASASVAVDTVLCDGGVSHDDGECGDDRE